MLAVLDVYRLTGQLGKYSIIQENYIKEDMEALEKIVGLMGVGPAKFVLYAG